MCCPMCSREADRDGGLKKGKTRALKTDGSLMQVEILQNTPREYSAIHSTCNKLSPVLKAFVLIIFE